MMEWPEESRQVRVVAPIACGDGRTHGALLRNSTRRSRGGGARGWSRQWRAGAARGGGRAHGALLQ